MQTYKLDYLVLGVHEGKGTALSFLIREISYVPRGPRDTVLSLGVEGCGEKLRI